MNKYFKKITFLTAIFCGLNLVAADKNKSPAKSVIEIWLWGGPSQLETFDPKPKSGYDINRNHKAIPTNVPGTQISEFLPELAKITNRYSIVRSMTHDIFAHETATYLMQTGRKPGNLVYPAIGTIISMMKVRSGEYKGKLPAYIAIPSVKGRFSELGFLSPKYKPLSTGGDPNAEVFEVDGIVSKLLSKQEFSERSKILKKLDVLGKAASKSNAVKQFDQAEKTAVEIITGEARKVFNLAEESDETRNRYCRNTFGQSCLAARRLVEYGVPYIAINFNGWDTHKRHFAAAREKLAQLDQGLSALLLDLEKRGLLKSTIVWCGGEFGRRPLISWESPWNGGRQHHPLCFSALVAGGGFKGGKVVGESDATATHVKSRPVYPQDFLGSICEMAGIDPDSYLPNPIGKKIRVMPKESKLGRLRELYTK